MMRSISHVIRKIFLVFLISLYCDIFIILCGIGFVCYGIFTGDQSVNKAWWIATGRLVAVRGLMLSNFSIDFVSPIWISDLSPSKLLLQGLVLGELYKSWIGNLEMSEWLCSMLVGLVIPSIVTIIVFHFLHVTLVFSFRIGLQNLAMDLANMYSRIDADIFIILDRALLFALDTVMRRI